MTPLSADESSELAQSVRAACARLATEERVRAIAYGGAGGQSPGFDADLWDVLCNQVGVAAIALPEHLGGAGYGAAALGVVAHELGRALAPVPFVSSTVLATGLLSELSGAPDAETRLAGLIEGRRLAAAVLTGDGGMWSPAAVTLQTMQVGGRWQVDGTARHVLGGTVAHDLVVVAQTETARRAILLIDPAHDGVLVEHEHVLDGTRPMATIKFDSAPAILLSSAESVDDIVDHHVRMALSVLSAEQVGTCERVLETATGYAKERHQFGRPIGSFQAIKHKCADMLVNLEWARSASQAALQIADDRCGGADGSGWRAHMAKAVCSEATRDATHANVQIRGGLGFTWEDTAHLYLRRARTDEVLFGSPAHHWDRVAAFTQLV